MKATNFKEAAQISLDDRWYKIVKAERVQEMYNIFYKSDCELCELQKRRGYNPAFECGDCPLRDFDSDSDKACCKEYYAWSCTSTKNDYDKALEAAQALVKRLEEIANGTE